MRCHVGSQHVTRHGVNAKVRKKVKHIAALRFVSFKDRDMINGALGNQDLLDISPPLISPV